MLTKHPQKRQVKNLMSKSICTFFGQKSITSPTYLESPLERDYCYFLEFDTSVVHYEAQPLGLIYWNPATQKECQYTPDFKVWFSDGSFLYYEIKYQRDVERSKDFQVLFQLAKQEAQKYESNLILVTDSFISQQYLYENLVLLFRYINVDLNFEYVQTVKQLLKQNKKLPITELVDTRTEQLISSSVQQLYKLIWLKQLVAPLTYEFLNMKTEVSLEEDVFNV